MRKAEEIIEKYNCDQANLIAIMQEIQAEDKYLSEETLTLIAEKPEVSAAKVHLIGHSGFTWNVPLVLQKAGYKTIQEVDSMVQMYGNGLCPNKMGKGRFTLYSAMFRTETPI